MSVPVSSHIDANMYVPSETMHCPRCADAEHNERMANWTRGYDAGVIAGRREVRQAIRDALGLDDRYEMLTPAD